MTAPADLAEVRAALALVAQATPGPWRTFGQWPHLAVVSSGSGRPRIVASLASASDAVDDTPKDAAAIVALRNAAPAIAAAVEELEDARAETARQRETIRAGADAVRSANASTTEIGCRLDDAGERIAALSRQVCRLVSGQEIDGDRLCQHHGADVAALALLSDERAAHAETSRDLDALLTALGAQVTPGGQTLESCHARRVADGMRRASSIAAEIERARAEGRAESPAAPATVARPISEWHEDRGSALWWRFPVEEPPYSGSPLDSDWPGYHTHWTPIVCPDEPQGQADAGRASRGPIGAANPHPDGCHTTDATAPRCSECSTPCPTCGAESAAVPPVSPRTLYECRTCSTTTGGGTDGSFDDPRWRRITNIDGPDAICPTCIADPVALDDLREEYPRASIAAGPPTDASAPWGAS